MKKMIFFFALFLGISYSLLKISEMDSPEKLVINVQKKLQEHSSSELAKQSQAVISKSVNAVEDSVSSVSSAIDDKSEGAKEMIQEQKKKIKEMSDKLREKILEEKVTEE